MNLFEIPEYITRYTELHTTEEDPLLKELYRSTYLKTVHPQMISGKVQGQFLQMISRMIRPRRILEIGTFTGYSAYCLAAGLPDNGRLVTIEVNDELEPMTRDFFKKAGVEKIIDLIIGDARQIIPRLEGLFDLVFIDGNKEHYPEYYEICMKVLNNGGIMLADNVLWGGKVAGTPPLDHSSSRLDEFNKMVSQDPRTDQVLLTIRDGILLIRKH